MPPGPSWGRTGLLVAWVGALAASTVGLAAAGHGRLTGPELTDPGSWSAWAGDRTPVEAAFALGRLVGLALAGYLLIATVVAIVGAVGAAAGGARLASLAELVATPSVRRLVAGSLGVGLTGLSLVALPAGRSGPGAGPVSVAHARLVSITEPVPDDDEAPPVLRRLDDGVGAVDAVDAADAVPAASATEWVVAPGDHLWSVAERVLETARGRPVGDGEVAPYWRALVEANRPRLADPGNPDLLFPGQVLVVPPT